MEDTTLFNPNLINLVFQGEWIQVDPKEIPTVSEKLSNFFNANFLSPGTFDFFAAAVQEYREEMSYDAERKIIWAIVAGAVATVAAALFGVIGGPLAFFFVAGVSLAAIKMFSHKQEEECANKASLTLGNTIDYLNEKNKKIEKLLLRAEKENLEKQTVLIEDISIQENTEENFVLKEQSLLEEYAKIKNFYTRYRDNRPPKIFKATREFIDNNKGPACQFSSITFNDIQEKWAELSQEILEHKYHQTHYLFNRFEAIAPIALTITAIAIGILTGPAAWCIGLGAVLYLLVKLFNEKITESNIETKQKAIEDLKLEIKLYFEMDGDIPFNALVKIINTSKDPQEVEAFQDSLEEFNQSKEFYLGFQTDSLVNIS